MARNTGRSSSAAVREKAKVQDNAAASREGLATAKLSIIRLASLGMPEADKAKPAFDLRPMASRYTGGIIFTPAQIDWILRCTDA